MQPQRRQDAEREQGGRRAVGAGQPGQAAGGEQKGGSERPGEGPGDLHRVADRGVAHPEVPDRVEVARAVGERRGRLAVAGPAAGLVQHRDEPRQVQPGEQGQGRRPAPPAVPPDDHEEDRHPEGADVVPVAGAGGQDGRRGERVPGPRVARGPHGDPQQGRADGHDRRVVAGHRAVAPEQGRQAQQQRPGRGRRRPRQRAEPPPDGRQRRRAGEHVEPDEPAVRVARRPADDPGGGEEQGVREIEPAAGDDPDEHQLVGVERRGPRHRPARQHDERQGRQHDARRLPGRHPRPDPRRCPRVCPCPFGRGRVHHDAPSVVPPAAGRSGPGEVGLS